MSSPRSDRPSGNTAESFGDTSRNTLQSSPLRLSSQPNTRSSPRPLSSDRLSRHPSQLTDPLSVGTVSSQRFGTPRTRGDVQKTQALERFLASDAPSQPRENPLNVDQFIWGTTVNIEDSMGMFRDFITNFSDQELGNPFYDLVLQNMLEYQNFNLNLDCQKLKSYGPSERLYHQLLRYPQEIIPVMDHTLTQMLMDRFDNYAPDESNPVRVRPYNLARACNLRQLNPTDIDQLVSIKGLVIRSSPVIPDMKQAFFRCSTCDATVEVENDRGFIAEPIVCENCQSKNTMVLVHNRCVFSDMQVSRLQETPDETPDGQTPYTVSLCGYDDLMDVAKPGDRVEITGIFRGIPVRVNPRRRAVKSLFKTYVDIVHIKKEDKKRLGRDKTAVAENEYQTMFKEGDEMEVDDNEDQVLELSKRPDLYSLLARSVAPSIFGLDDVKKGVLLQLFGGSHKFSHGNGTPRIRGDLNVLLVGDPGVSKSQLLQYVHKLAPRGVYTSGKGSSAVGLTAYITRDPDTRQLVLESGALVLSDGGICCIDEFDKMSDQTRSVLHEVMEQQTISVAKAGIITTLNARTSILACANPINSKFDTNLSVAANVNLPPPLMSRFDLLYLILDKPNEADDRRLAQHLVSLYLTEKPDAAKNDIVPIELFTSYINYAKNIDPIISEEAGQTLANFYVSMRKTGSYGGSSNVITFTTRQLESMIRLSEAHAKMRLSQTVEKQDVEEAHRLILSALQTAAVDPRTGRIDLDLVTTGISAWGRQVHEQKRSAVRQLIQDYDKQTIKWPELLRLFQQQSDIPLADKDFNDILSDLVEENLIHVTGRNNADKVIRKLSL